MGQLSLLGDFMTQLHCLPIVGAKLALIKRHEFCCHDTELIIGIGDNLLAQVWQLTDRSWLTKQSFELCYWIATRLWAQFRLSGSLMQNTCWDTGTAEQKILLFAKEPSPVSVRSCLLLESGSIGPMHARVVPIIQTNIQGAITQFCDKDVARLYIPMPDPTFMCLHHGSSQLHKQ